MLPGCRTQKKGSLMSLQHFNIWTVSLSHPSIASFSCFLPHTFSSLVIELIIESELWLVILYWCFYVLCLMWWSLCLFNCPLGINKGNLNCINTFEVIICVFDLILNLPQFVFNIWNVQIYSGKWQRTCI